MVNVKIPKIVGAFFLLAIIGFVGFVIPLTQLLGNQEITNPEYSFQFFLFLGIFSASSIMVIGMLISRFWWKEDDSYTNSFGFFDLNSKITLLPRKFTAIQLTLLSTIFFSILFFIANLLGSKGIFGSKVLPQQFSKTQSLIFSTLQIPASEEMMAIAVVGLLVIGLIIIAKKLKWDFETFRAVYFSAIPMIMGIFAIVWHISAYAGSDLAFGVVGLFWVLKTFLILATGFFVVGWIMHILNNFFIDFSRLFASDVVLYFVVITFIIIPAVAYFYLYRDRLLGEKK